MDIFKATLSDNGNVSNVVNLGEPFNTKADDYGFVVSADGNEAYFVRNGDVYMAKLTSGMSAIKPLPVSVLTGTIRDKATGKPVTAKISIRLTSEMDADEISSNADGYYSAVLQLGKTYQQTITASGFKEVKRTITAPASQKSSALQMDVALVPQ